MKLFQYKSTDRPLHKIFTNIAQAGTGLINDLDTRSLYCAFALLTLCIEQQNERKVLVQRVDFVQYQKTHLPLRQTACSTKQISEPLSP